MKFRLVEDFDDLLLEYKAAIEPGSDLEKKLIYELENTNKSYRQLGKEYGVTHNTIKHFAELRNLGDNRKLVRAIEPGSDLEKSLIYDIENTDKTYIQLSKEYGIPRDAILRLSYSKNLRDKKELSKYHVYFNTLEAADIHRLEINNIHADLKFHPSVYIGMYSIRDIDKIYTYISKKYFNGAVNTTTLIEFYLKIASGKISLKTIIDEMKEHSTVSFSSHRSTFDRKFLTMSTEELATVDFYSANYSQIAKDILIFLSRKDSNSTDFDIRYKDLKDAAVKLDLETADCNNEIDTYISNNLDSIAHNIYSKEGNIVEANNYINGIPYETSFDVRSPQDVARCMKPYKSYLLYGFMDKTGDIVYIGISATAESRGNMYAKENRPLILKAFEDHLIKKFIVFKSNLPVHSRTVNTKLIYALEVYFAEQLFKTYPENYPKALNKQKPGRNTSKIVASQNRTDFERFINKQDRVLSVTEFMSAGKEILNVSSRSVQKLYPYYKYAQDYISKHDGELSIKDKQTLYKSLYGDTRHTLWDICASESEYRKIVPKNKNTYQVVNSWRNYRIENNLPITEDLDDDIDMEYYV